MAILYFLIVFSVLVFAHEFGHFIVAKKQGITVHEFGFGFPPRIFSRMWRGTLYSLNALPLGGFVRIKGEEGEDADAPDSFMRRGVLSRASVIAAGVVCNILLGWLLLTIGFLSGVPQVLDQTVPEQYIRSRSIVIESLLPHAPATEADVRVGDAITAIDGTPVARITDLQSALASRDGKETVVTLARRTEIVNRTLTPRYVDEAKRVGIGVGLDEIGTVRYPFFAALWQGVRATGFILKETVVAFAGVVRDLIVLQKVSVDVSGPIGIAVLTGKVARQGFIHLLQFAAILSLNLAVVNVLPIPALDGGRLFFLAIETIRRKALAKKTEALLHRAGFILLLLLVALVTYRDVLKFFIR
ncbi:RIP metalloprotease RseP [Candidatus Uhrbacteria bacterium]|nr:RIP metalloprotease RseP [Candidatus Uhrbacteria bacterium]